MGKLHELLAVEADVENTYKAMLKETMQTFQTKAAHFTKWIKSLHMFKDDSSDGGEIENVEMVTTVKDKLDYFSNYLREYLNLLYQKELTNQIAVANIEINGDTIAANVPVTFLLGLETRLKAVREMLLTIPTLTPGIAWEKDSTLGENVYKAKNDVKTFKTAKAIKHKVLYEATKEHPAQIERWTEEENVGEYIIRKWSSMISPAEKVKYLTKVDNLIKAVKQAKQRANNIDLNPGTIGTEIVDYLSL